MSHGEIPYSFPVRNIYTLLSKHQKSSRGQKDTRGMPFRRHHQWFPIKVLRERFGVSVSETEKDHALVRQLCLYDITYVHSPPTGDKWRQNMQITHSAAVANALMQSVRA